MQGLLSDTRRGSEVVADLQIMEAAMGQKPFVLEAAHNDAWCEAELSSEVLHFGDAWMESTIGKTKHEVIGENLPASHSAAQQQLFAGIQCWYNQRRRHSALGYQSPVAFENQFMNN